MLKKVLCLFLSICVLVSGLIVFAETDSQANSATNFTFGNGVMSKEVLRSYVSRAVTHQGFCVERDANPIFDEDLRFLRRIGAKFIGRAAMLSWNGNLTAGEIENHFQLAEEYSEKAHKVKKSGINPLFIIQITFL